MRQIYIFLATGCYSGYLPIAPGTWGTVVGVGIFWMIGWLPPLLYIVTTIAFIFLAIWVADHGSRIFQQEDPPQVVIDEIAGYLVTMAFHGPNLYVAIAGFILFRIFDITKPPPIRWIERRFPGGAGIVLDDVAAGIYANAILWIFVVLAARAGIVL